MNLKCNYLQVERGGGGIKHNTNLRMNLNALNKDAKTSSSVKFEMSYQLKQEGNIYIYNEVIIE